MGYSPTAVASASELVLPIPYKATRHGGALQFWRAVLSVGALLIAGTTSAHAGTFTAFGPQDYTRGTGAPVTVTNTFSVLNPNTQYTLKAFNGGLQDNQTELVSSGFVTVNGVQVLGPNNFNQNVKEVDVPVTLQAVNTLSVQVRGQPGGVLTIQIVGVDNDPPTITAIASPAPNAAGWNNSNVTVTFSCSDATSAVASCPGPQTVTTEGAKQIISGTATDAAGNSATTSITLNIDKTPPTITAALSPAANAAGWNNSNVTVSFTCSDSLSGVANCPALTTVTTEGASQAVSGTATDVAGNTASTSVTVKLDKTPPTISITSPANGAMFTTSSAAVTGSVSDALSGVSAVTCDGAPATVQSGAFSCSVTLNPGSNTITAQATDVAGNSSSATESVTFSNAPPPVITSFSPTSAAVGIQVTLAGSNFTASGTATPQVTLGQQGGGSIAAPIVSFTATSISFIIPAGAASGQITVTVGNQSVVSAASLSVVASSSFSLSASPSTANVQQGTSVSISVGLSSSNGFSQLADLSLTGLPTGVTASFSPVRMTAGQFSILTITAPAAQPVGNATLTISAAATVQGIPTTQSASASLNVQAATTSLIGRIVESDNIETPIPGIIATFLGVDDAGHTTGCSGQTRSDAAGNFAFTNLGTSCLGRQLVGYDGNSSTDGEKYAGVNLAYTMIAGQITGPELVHLPVITNAETIMVKQNATVDQVFSYSTIPGITVTVYAGTTLTLPDGTKPDPFPMAAVLVPVDRLPDAPAPTTGMLRASIVAFQPANTTSNQPVSVMFPNVVNTPPGVNMELDTLDPIVGELVKYGTGTVSADASEIVPDPDPAHPGHRFGISHFDWHGPMAPAPNGNNPCPNPPCANGGDPVDLSSGLLNFTKTDITFGGARGQVSIDRTYRTLSGAPGPFGVGTNHDYGYFLDITSVVRGTGNLVNLGMPDGNQLPFAQQGTNTFVNSNIPSLLGSVITSPSSGTFNLRWKNGTVFRFASPSAFATVAFLNSITDANGNTTTLVRGNSAQPIQITQIIDPVGRVLNLTYDNFNRILSMTDPVGQTVQYTYNAQGTLATVTDPAKGVTTYAYDTQNRMTTITDGRQITYLQNLYDANGRVSQQTAADGGITTFAYTLLNPTVSTSPVLLTTVTDPRGNSTVYHFNPQGFLLDVTDALGEKTTYTLDPGTNQVISVTDPLNRTTEFTRDSAGNMTSITSLAGTPDAITTSFSYDPTFSKLTSITDPLNHTTSFTYDKAGNLTQAVDPLNHKVTLTYDGAGQLLTTTDPLGNITRRAYDAFGNLIRVTDPLGRTMTTAADAIGRQVSTTNALGGVTLFQYNPLGQVTKIIDTLAGETSFAYDPNGNLTGLTDASKNTTQYAYDNMDRLSSRLDPLGNTETFKYDQNGNITQYTDRRGTITKYQHDVLNRRTVEQFGSESTVTYIFDAGARVIQAKDSITGTITRAYDGLDRLTSELTPRGSVAYTYDASGRKTGLTIAGQPVITYSYDNANRPTQVAQGGSAASFTYDAANRRISLTLPNGVTTTYSYDLASQLTGLNYSSGSGALGNLGYSYDPNGRRSSANGTFARTGLPAVVSGTSYNANNQLTRFGSSNLTYDSNGNLLSDGVNTYTWDARNQLVSISGATSASFQYDPLGRRVSKTTSGATTSYLYDGINVAEELSGGVLAANFLTAGADEILTRTDSSGPGNFLTDALGSVVAVTGATGSAFAQYTYEPFGNTTVSGNSVNTYQYTGRENDGTGLYYERARYYNPLLQRFISEDPTGLLGGDANLYAYVGNAPTNLTDPLGTCSSGGEATSAAGGAGIGTGVGLDNALTNWNNPTAGGQARLGYPDPSMRYGWARTAHLDAPDAFNGYHFNADAGPLTRFNHAPIPEWAYDLGSTKNLGRIAKGAAVVGVAIDVYNIATAGRKQRIGAIGGAAGGYIGAEIGAAIGTALLPGVGTIIGGLIGGVIGGAVGQAAGNEISDNVYGCH
jgi:RHS repeat-associated protein